jgi:hypothetical protein
MDGYTLSRDVRELLNEDSTSLFIDSRNTYDYLYEAACDLNSKIHALTSSQTITTVDGTSEYVLNSDFMGLYLKNDNNFYVKLYDGTSYYWVRYSDPDSIYYLNNTDEVAIPNQFTISDYQALTTRITGAATADGTSTYGECTLTDTTSPPFTDVTVGDMVHNITDGSHGVVISITSTSAIITSLFDGTNNDWTSGDTYMVVPKGRMMLTLDPIPSTSAYSVYVEYLQKPEPVFSLYKTYRFDNTWRFALAKYAAWLYKYRDREPNYGDSWYKYYDMQIRNYKRDHKKASNKGGFKVYLEK